MGKTKGGELKQVKSNQTQTGTNELTNQTRTGKPNMGTETQGSTWKHKTQFWAWRQVVDEWHNNVPQDLVTVSLCIHNAINKMHLCSLSITYACPYHKPTATMGRQSGRDPNEDDEHADELP